MRLHILMRSCGVENTKPRPLFYDKTVALASVLAAVEATRVGPIDITFLNDGAVPLERLRLMQERGVVVRYDGLGMRGSYWGAIELALKSGWANGDLVYFTEDDYLYEPNAFDKLLMAAEELPRADYFALYAQTPDHPIEPGFEDVIPRGWRPLPPWTIDGQTWCNVVSHTSTFGARIRAIRQDKAIFRQAMWPLRTRLWDHETCVMYQGLEPFSWTQTLRDLVWPAGDTVDRRMKNWVNAPFKVGMNLRSHRRPGRRRLLVAPDPNLAAHMEVGLLPPGRDWEGIADAAARWLAEAADSPVST
jgi:hypothetical protein